MNLEKVFSTLIVGILKKKMVAWRESNLKIKKNAGVFYFEREVLSERGGSLLVFS